MEVRMNTGLIGTKPSRLRHKCNRGPSKCFVFAEGINYRNVSGGERVRIRLHTPTHGSSPAPPLPRWDAVVEGSHPRPPPLDQSSLI